MIRVLCIKQSEQFIIIASEVTHTLLINNIPIALKTVWCKYRNDNANYNDKKRLDPVFRVELKKNLWELTENQNEANNGVLWRLCRKNSFCGLDKLKLAVSIIVGRFNSGGGYYLQLLEGFVDSIGENTINGFEQQDVKRIKDASRKITGTSRLRRQDNRKNKKKKIR